MLGGLALAFYQNTISKFPNDMLSLLDLLPRKSTLKKYVKIGKKDHWSLRSICSAVQLF